MVFKLTQIDSENPVKIQLELGTHIFGRGKFLNINDKRISRQHGQFEVTDDSLTITALHQNPCFYQKKGSLQEEILRKSSSVNLTSGDKIGLLPTSHWYEVLYVENIENKENQMACQEINIHEIANDSSEETDNETESRLNSNTNNVSDNVNLESQSTEVMSPCQLDIKEGSNDYDDKEKCDSQKQDTFTTEKTCIDSVLIGVDTDKTNTSQPGSPSLLLTNQVKEESNEAGPSSTDQCDAAQKRPHSVSEDGQADAVKKIKTEPEVKPNVNSDLNGQPAGSSNNNNVVTPPVAPQVPLRERCMYGASCYRRHPLHRSQFSHPYDADWGTGAKAPCPWGAACRKRDPRHWRDHDHPPGKDQPPPQPGIKKKRNRSVSPSDNLIVTGKRVRRSVMKVNWDASDESDSDPYKTDAESDEWEPSSESYTEYTESQN